jgi:16S rRNA (cytidine1402-2'-O)-methyltransferase
MTETALLSAKQYGALFIWERGFMLFVVAVPLGNFGDMPPRAVETLKAVDLVLCEDTRTSFPLLKEFNVVTPLKSYHKFNEEQTVAPLVERLRSGENIALITDAGTPCVSDPGAKLIEAAANAGVEITALPSPCAAIAALSISGFNAVSFTFRGFLPRTKGKLAAVLAATLTEPSPVTIFYEAPMRIIATVEAMTVTVPDSRLCLCNDLTKPHERIYRGLPASVLEELRSNPKAQKGEYTIVLSRLNVKPPKEKRSNKYSNAEYAVHDPAPQKENPDYDESDE